VLSLFLLFLVSTMTITARNDSFSFPSEFILRDLASITSPVFPFKISPHLEAAEKSATEWFRTYVRIHICEYAYDGYL
jgi:hypothetical protein